MADQDAKAQDRDVGLDMLMYPSVGDSFEDMVRFAEVEFGNYPPAREMHDPAPMAEK